LWAGYIPQPLHGFTQLDNRQLHHRRNEILQQGASRTRDRFTNRNQACTHVDQVPVICRVRLNQALGLISCFAALSKKLPLEFIKKWSKSVE